MITYDAKLGERFRLLCTIAAGVLTAVSFVIMVGGYYFTVNNLRSLFLDCAKDKVSFDAALSFALLGLCVLATTPQKCGKVVKISATTVSLALALYMILSIVQTFSNGLWIPEIRIQPFDPESNSFAITSQTTLDVSILMLLYGTSFAVGGVKKWKIQNWRIFELLALAGCCISIIPVIGKLTGQEELCSIGGCIKQPISVAIMSLTTAFALLFRDLNGSQLLVATQTSFFGAAFRRLLVIPLLACPVLIAVRDLLLSTGLADAALASTLSLTALAIITVQLLWSANSVVNPGAHSALQGTQLGSEQSPEAAAAAPGAAPLAMARSQDVHDLDSTRPASPRDVMVEATTIVPRTGRGGTDGPERASAVRMVCDECGDQFDENLETCPRDGSELRIEVVDRLIGTVFAERYRIDKLLGKGGMSTVYLAKQTLMGKQVAIKLLHSNILSNVSVVRRFQHEAKAMSRLKHPNILSVSDFSFFDGMPYIIMDYIEGASLQEFLNKHETLTLRQFFDIATQICAGLSHAHKHEIIHRDLKPANIMLVKTDADTEQVMIVDFGLAKLAGSDSGMDRITQTGDCMGSPRYMSPEQVSGSNADHRTDIYSLGCMFFECLTGIPPLEGTSALMVMHAHLSEAPAPFPESANVPPDLQKLIYSMLEKDPESRPKDINAVYGALQAARTQATVA